MNSQMKQKEGNETARNSNGNKMVKKPEENPHMKKKEVCIKGTYAMKIWKLMDPQ